MHTPSRSVTPSGEPPAPSPFFRYRFADVDYDESLGLLRVAGVEVDIEPRPRELLSELLRRPNEVVAREELMEALWQGRPTVDNVLANAITKLRRALGPEGAERLVNVPRVGYRLAGPIERVAVGQHAGSLPALVAGERVPGREAYLLEAPLGRGAAPSLVWRVRDPKLQDTRIFKFAADGERLGALKREYTLYRVLRAELGERDDFARVVAANFGTAPYFIECEDGGPDLLAWADADHRLAGCSTAQRIALFLQIARAVAAAHGVGVLHKDLKPANVLVSATGDGWQTRLTDFGSSRLLEPGRLAALGVTAMGLTVTHGVGSDSAGGTPLYLAPELLAGRSPTTQSDLYALGLMLWQLVVGDLRRPMSTGWQREVADALLIEDIAAATEGRPEDRLGSVAELVERLQTLEVRREKATEAAEAARRAVSLAADSARRRARRPWLAAAFVALAAGLATSLWFYGQARAALWTAQQESARAESINEFMAEDFVSGIGVDKVGPGATVSMLQVLRTASQRASMRFSRQPLANAEVQMEIGRTMYRLGLYDESIRQFKSAMAFAESLPQQARSASLLKVIRLRSALVLATVNKGAEAQRLIDQVSPDPSEDPIEVSNPIARPLAQARLQLAVSREKYRDALISARRLVSLSEALPGYEVAPRFAARFLLAGILQNLGDYAEAERTCLTLFEPPFDTRTVGEVQQARTLRKLAQIRSAMGKMENVESDLLKAKDILLRTLGPKDESVATTDAQLGSYYEDRGNFGRAAAAFQQAYDVYSAGGGKERSPAKIALLNLAIMQIHDGHSATGLAGLETGRPWFVERMGGEQGGTVQSIDFYRAQALTDLGRAMDALTLLDTLNADRLREGSPARDWPGRIEAERGRALLKIGSKDQGRAALRHALDQMEAAGSPEWLKASYRGVLM